MVNLYTEELGNPAVPEKLRAARVAAAARKKQVALQRMSVDEQFYRDTESIAFPKLNDHQLSLLEPLGRTTRRESRRAGLQSRAARFWLNDCLARRNRSFCEQRDGTEQIIATAHERDFIGDVSMLQGTSALASARVTSPDAEILHVPAAEFSARFGRIPGVS